VYLLKEVPPQHQQMINKFLEAQWKKYYEKGEEILMRELESLMENRLMSVKRATGLPEEFVTEAMDQYNKSKQNYVNQAIQQHKTYQKQ
jgi:predicted nucleic-acid-binding protein